MKRRGFLWLSFSLILLVACSKVGELRIEMLDKKISADKSQIYTVNAKISGIQDKENLKITLDGKKLPKKVINDKGNLAFKAALQDASKKSEQHKLVIQDKENVVKETLNVKNPFAVKNKPKIKKHLPSKDEREAFKDAIEHLSENDLLGILEKVEPAESNDYHHLKVYVADDIQYLAAAKKREMAKMIVTKVQKTAVLTLFDSDEKQKPQIEVHYKSGGILVVTDVGVADE